MAQFDIHPNPSADSRDDLPYLLNLQDDALHDLPSRVLAPLARPKAGFRPTRPLNPQVEVNGEILVVTTNQLAALPSRVLGPPVASLGHRRHEMIAALDFLFAGI